LARVGQDTAPTTVWICPGAPGAESALWPPAVIAHAISAFSTVGEHVRIAFAGTTAATPEGTRERDAALALVRRLHRTPAPPPPPPAPAPPAPAPSTPAPGGARPDSCRLLIAAVPAGCRDATSRVAGLAVGAARVVVVLTGTGTGTDPDGTLIDPAGAIIAAAQARGLRYLQHIVAIHVPTTTLIAGRVTAAADNAADNPLGNAVDTVEPDDGQADTAADRAGSSRPRRVHSDVLVFVAGDRS